MKKRSITDRLFNKFCRVRGLNHLHLTRKLKAHFLERAYEAEFWGSVLRQHGIHQEARRQIMPPRGSKKTPAGGFAGAEPTNGGGVAVATPPQSMQDLLAGVGPAAPAPAALLSPTPTPDVSKLLNGPSLEAEVVEEMKSTLQKATGLAGGDSTVAIAKVQVDVGEMSKKLTELVSAHKRFEADVKEGQIRAADALAQAETRIGQLLNQLLDGVREAAGQAQGQQTMAAPTLPAENQFAPPAPAPPLVGWIAPTAPSEPVNRLAAVLGQRFSAMWTEYIENYGSKGATAKFVEDFTQQAQTVGISDSMAFLSYFGFFNPQTSQLQAADPAAVAAKGAALSAALQR